MSYALDKFEVQYLDLERSLKPTVLHAILVSLTVLNIYGVRALKRDPFTHSAKYILLALGGGISASFLMGKPCSILLSNTTIPLYLSVFLIVSYAPLVATFLTKLSIIIDPILITADAIVRSFSLVNTVNAFETTVSSTSTLGAFIIGFVSITFGGVLCELSFSEFCRPSRFKHWNLYVCAVASLACAYYVDISDLTNNMDIEFLSVANGQVNQSRKLVAFYILFFGFFLKSIALFITNRPKVSKATTHTVRIKQNVKKNE